MAGGLARRNRLKLPWVVWACQFRIGCQLISAHGETHRVALVLADVLFGQLEFPRAVGAAHDEAAQHAAVTVDDELLQCAHHLAVGADEFGAAPVGIPYEIRLG